MQAITYPARPINGGPLESAAPLLGPWAYEPKLNGWRALIHVPTGTMFNRQGQELSIAGEFGPALAQLRASPFEWLDAEALERRHGLGRGTLWVFDVVTPAIPYRQRKGQLTAHFNYGEPARPPAPDEVWLVPELCASRAEALPWYRRLQQLNQAWGGEFFEGLVAKRLDSLYPIQLTSPAKEFSGWTKFRWRW